MSSNNSIITVKRPWGRELYVSLATVLVGFSYYFTENYSLIALGYSFASLIVFVGLFYRRLMICTKVIFDNEHVTLHFNQRAVCLRYLEIEKARIIQFSAKKPYRIIFTTHGLKSYSLPMRYFDLNRIQDCIQAKLKSKQIEKSSFFVPTLFKNITKPRKVFRPFHWQDYLPTLRFTNIIQVFLILITVTTGKTIKEMKMKELFASNQNELLICKQTFSQSCVEAATARAKFYFKIDESGIKTIDQEPIELNPEHRLVIHILDLACNQKVGESCFLLSLIHAKIEDWPKSLTYFERSLENSKGEKVSMLGEHVPSEEYYAARYSTMNKGSRVLASEEYKELAARHRSLKIEVSQ
ncbi:MAG: hypothetical protein ACOYL6_18625 [Bacteriovoracaceae bacterium]